MSRFFGYSLWTLAGSLLLPMPAALAQGNEEELARAYGDKATVSIATGSQQTLRHAPAVASVMTAEDIAAMGATDLDEVLEAVPGVHVSHSANNYSPLFVMRGIYSQLNPQTLLLQNGAPMTTLQQGNLDKSTHPQRSARLSGVLPGACAMPSMPMCVNRLWHREPPFRTICQWHRVPFICRPSIRCN